MRITRTRRPRKKTRRNKKRSRMKGGSAPLSEMGSIFSHLGFLSQSAVDLFHVPIPTLQGQLPQTPLVSQQFPLIKPLLLD
jgi:hypothetical protein